MDEATIAAGPCVSCYHERTLARLTGLVHQRGIQPPQRRRWSSMTVEQAVEARAWAKATCSAGSMPVLRHTHRLTKTCL